MSHVIVFCKLFYQTWDTRMKRCVPTHKIKIKPKERITNKRNINVRKVCTHTFSFIIFMVRIFQGKTDLMVRNFALLNYI